jgi:hypothetical protein
MQVTKVEAIAHTRPLNPNPIRDALQVLPGAGSVEVRVETDEGVTGRGDVYFGRVAGGPAALVAFTEQVLTPLVVGTDPAAVRATHEAMLRETEYLGSFGLARGHCRSVALWTASAARGRVLEAVGRPSRRCHGRLEELPRRRGSASVPTPWSRDTARKIKVGFRRCRDASAELVRRAGDERG